MLGERALPRSLMLCQLYYVFQVDANKGKHVWGIGTACHIALVSSECGVMGTLISLDWLIMLMLCCILSNLPSKVLNVLLFVHDSLMTRHLWSY